MTSRPSRTLLIRRMPVAAVLVVCQSLAVAAEPNAGSLCKPDEAVVFNCFTGKKTASLCASPTEAAPTMLAYRYGAGSTVENEFVATAANGQNFSGTVAPAAPRAWVSQVWFERSSYRYLMTECVGGDCSHSAGLTVFKGERMLMNAACQRRPGSPLAAFSSELVKFGSGAADSQSSTPLLRIEDADLGAYELYAPRK